MADTIASHMSPLAQSLRQDSENTHLGIQIPGAVGRNEGAKGGEREHNISGKTTSTLAEAGAGQA